MVAGSELVFVDVKTAAEKLGLAVSTLRRMASAGQVPCLRAGVKRGKIMFNVEQVREHLLIRAAN